MWSYSVKKYINFYKRAQINLGKARDMLLYDVIEEYKVTPIEAKLFFKDDPDLPNTTAEFYILISDLFDGLSNDARYPSLSVKNPGKITFFNNAKSPSERESILASDPDAKDRQVTTIGKYIMPLLDELLSTYKSKDRIKQRLASELSLYLNEKVVDLINTELGVVTEKKEQELIDFYEKTKMKSCMTREYSRFMQLLADNPDKVLLVTIGDNARALLWKCDDGTIVLDRAYPKDGKLVPTLRKWAKDKGYVLRENPDRLQEGSVKLSDGKQHFVTLRVNPNVTQFPYLDTFKFGEFYPDKTLLILSNMDDFGNCTFINIDGSYASETCSDCGRGININDSYTNDDDEPICETCFIENYFRCSRCRNIKSDEEENRFEDDDHSFCNNCFSEIAAKCYLCEKIVDIRSEAYRTEDSLEYFCDDCSEKLDECELCEYLIGIPNVVYYFDGSAHNICIPCCRKEKFDICKECGKYIPYKLINDTCKKCFPESYTRQYRLPFTEEDANVNEYVRTKAQNKNKNNKFGI